MSRRRPVVARRHPVGRPPFEVRTALHGFMPGEDDGGVAGKVRTMVMHPTRDWIAVSDGAQRVAVWDYVERRLVRTFTPHAVAQACRGSADVAADALFVRRSGQIVAATTPLSESAAAQIGVRSMCAAAAAAAKPDAAAAKPAPPAVETGEVQAVLFHDLDAVRWSAGCTAREAALAAAQSAGAKRRVPAGAWTVAVCTHALVFVEMELGRARVVMRHEIVAGGESSGSGGGHGHSHPHELTCAALVSARIVAVGCGDGTVRLWDMMSGRAACVLPAFARSVRVASLASFPDQAATRDDVPSRSSSGASGCVGVRLIAAGVDGSAAVWSLELVGNVVIGASAAPTLVFGDERGAMAKASEPDGAARAKAAKAIGHISALAVNCAQGCVGVVSEKGVWHWAEARAKGVQSAAWRVTPAGGDGAKLTCLVAAQPPLCPLASWWGGSSRSSLLHLVGTMNDIDAPQGSRAVPLSTPVIDLRDMLHLAHATGATPRAKSGEGDDALSASKAVAALPKKGIKVYSLCAHPLNPSLLACGTNVGLFVLEMGRRLTFSATLLTLNAAVRERAGAAALAASSDETKETSEAVALSALSEMALCIAQGSLYMRRPDSAESVRLLAVRQPRVFEREIADGICAAKTEAATAATRAARASSRKERKAAAEIEQIARVDGSTDRRGFPLLPLTDDTPLILPSSSGAVVAILWRRAARYVLIEVGTIHRSSSSSTTLSGTAWLPIEEGEATSLAWAAHRDILAKVSTDGKLSIVELVNTLSEAQKAEAQRRAVLAAAGMALPATGEEVPTYRCEPMGDNLTIGGVPSNMVVQRVIGGVLLSVILSKAAVVDAPTRMLSAAEMIAARKKGAGLEAYGSSTVDPSALILHRHRGAIEKRDHRCVMCLWEPHCAPLLETKKAMRKKKAKDAASSAAAAANVDETPPLILISVTGPLKQSLQAPRNALWSACRRWVALIYDADVHMLSVEEQQHVGGGQYDDAKDGGNAAAAASLLPIPPLRLQWGSSIDLSGVLSGAWHSGGLPVLALATADEVVAVIVRGRANAVRVASSSSTDADATEWLNAYVAAQTKRQSLSSAVGKRSRGATAQERPTIVRVASYARLGAASDHCLLEHVRGEDIGESRRDNAASAAAETAAEALSRDAELPRCGGPITVVGLGPRGNLVLMAGPKQELRTIPLGASSTSHAATTVQFRVLLATARAAAEAELTLGSEQLRPRRDAAVAAGVVLLGTLRFVESWIAQQQRESSGGVDVAQVAIDLAQSGLVAVALHLRALPTPLRVALCLQHGVLAEGIADDAASAAAVPRTLPTLVRPLLVLLGRVAAAAHPAAVATRWGDQELDAALCCAVRGDGEVAAEGDASLRRRAETSLERLAEELDRVGMHDDALLAATLLLAARRDSARDAQATVRAVLARQQRLATLYAFDVAQGVGNKLDS